MLDSLLCCLLTNSTLNIIGQWVIEKTRPDIIRKFSAFVSDVDAIPQYLYQCNSQNPT